MKCANCGMELSASDKKCVRCGREVSQGFNYRNMENELVNTVIEEEIMTNMSEKSVLYRSQKQQEEPETEEDEEKEEKTKKQWGRLGAALLIGTAVFQGILFGLRSFSDEYVYGKTETEYQNCLTLLAKEDYEGALKSVDSLLLEDEGNLEYLSLKNTICQNTGDSGTQMEVLKQILAADADNYPAYEQLLQLYLAEEDSQQEIVKLAENAPNSVISSMLKAYIVEAPYLELTPGVYDTSQLLEITSEDGHNIYYTLDGSSPLENGVLYYTPIVLEPGHYTVTAVCRNENGVYGEETSGEYQIGIQTENGAYAGGYQSDGYAVDGGIY